MTHHERTCVRSPVQSLVHGKCSINGRNVDEHEEEGDADASLTLGFRVQTLNLWLLGEP